MRQFIHWKHNLAGYCGGGSEPTENWKEWIDYGNSKFPELTHYTKPYPFSNYK